RTLYLDVASAAFLPRALWFEADRLSGLADTIDQGKLDNQRDVVLNERRETHENQPYGMAEILINEALWPDKHPYHSPTIGWAADLGAATLGDVKAFCVQHYVRAAALWAIAGDVDPVGVRAEIARDFGWIAARPAPARPSVAAPPPIEKPIRITADDDVQVP